MNNLGWYQVMTTWSKKVGGPLQLAGCIAAGGYVTGKMIVIPMKAVFNKIKQYKEVKKKEMSAQNIYTVNAFGITNEGINLYPDDKVKVMACDGKSVLVEIIGKEDNPYFLPADFLSEISNYE